jgi:endonuclease III
MRLQALALLSDKPLESLSQISKLVPDLRRAGFLTPGGMAAQENPFAMFSADTSLPENIRRIAKQYETSFSTGALDPEKVDERIKTLGEMAQRAQTSAQAQASLEENRRAVNELRERGLISQEQQRQFMQQMATRDRQMQEQMLELRRQAEANKPEQFSYAQKKEFDVVQRNVAEAKSAEDSAALAQRAAELIPRAYGGRIEAGLKGAAGVVGITTDAKTANDDLMRINQQLALKTPKFSGPTSDADAKRYDKAVGDLANPAVSAESKIKAIKEIQDLATKQADYARQQENYFYSNNKSLRGFEFKPAANPFGK